MPVPLQARARRPVPSRAALVLLLPVALAACTSSAGGLGDGVDTTVRTGDVANAPKPEADQLSDQATIRNAVSSADLSGLGGQPLSWANSDTGSRGAITALAEQRQNGQLCRRFTTSRENFEGVALYQGEACMAQAGIWRLLDFKPL